MASLGCCPELRLGLGMLKTPVTRHPSGKVRHSGDVRNGAAGFGVWDRLALWNFGWSLACLVRKCSPRPRLPRLPHVSPIRQLKPTVDCMEKDLQTSAQGGGRAVVAWHARHPSEDWSLPRNVAYLCAFSPVGGTTGIRGGELLAFLCEILFRKVKNKHAFAPLGVAIPARIEQRLAHGVMAASCVLNKSCQVVICALIGHMWGRKDGDRRGLRARPQVQGCRVWRFCAVERFSPPPRLQAEAGFLFGLHPVHQVVCFSSIAPGLIPQPLKLRWCMSARLSRRSVPRLVVVHWIVWRVSGRGSPDRETGHGKALFEGLPTFCSAH
ncbi:uncharacterized protein B0H64DRAFT_215645 [Chaetomium fimeti]|uniref:Uncharacterized protein n=1 Tax=Chaetomium fimeti TaxID=1854472 RepID=A0AAE0LQ96_9PEZI|nr:hypothetical protein B0H64DRAFT_215645 [Chaetomium fimeti]